MFDGWFKFFFGFTKFPGGEILISFNNIVLYSPLVKINAMTEIKISMHISKSKNVKNKSNIILKLHMKTMEKERFLFSTFADDFKESF